MKSIKGSEKNMKSLQSRKRQYVVFLYIFLGFALGMFLWVSYSYYEQKVPNTIRIKAGTSEEIDLGIPASGVLDVDSSKVIALNQPLTIVAGEELDSCQMELKLFGILPLKNIDIEVIENNKLIPVGQPIGIYMRTQGVLVIDTGNFKSADGQTNAPSQYKLQAGDYLLAIDGEAVNGKKQIKDYIENGNGNDVIMQVSRNDEVIQVKISPKQDENGVYKIGAWLRDSAQGIGTMTFLDENQHFGALGHGINDTDTGELLQLGSGLLYHTEIVAIRRGERGTPGELTGVIEYQPEQVSGVIMDNTEVGIYGIVSETVAAQDFGQALPVGLKQEVEIGAAQILCNIDGEAKYYDIEITKLAPNSENLNRQMAITVTDENLKSLTGGIVQGMSGAPIVQNGKFVGAVTHVLVDDPAKGYGIFIEEMLEQ